MRNGSSAKAFGMVAQRRLEQFTDEQLQTGPVVRPRVGRTRATFDARDEQGTNAGQQRQTAQKEGWKFIESKNIFKKLHARMSEQGTGW